ncbi:hypothetical protein F2P56_014298 [Juglans regia]|uniref:(+)-neomenthol dehydrogenase-like n=1 Tax=Juglans regia TaxID=51240 RepID=A0A833XD51_JUGRE|nr:hypothetical protein F2P56_014298 [Juglans regia]
MAESTKRYAVVTGANKGIGFEIVRQLASNGIVVVLTARDEKRGLEALQKLNLIEIDFLVLLQAGAGIDRSKLIQNYELAEECLQTNYYGARRMAEALISVLQLSSSPRIVNISSAMGKLENIQNKWAEGILGDAENLTEEKVDEVLKEFLKDFKEGSLASKVWPTFLSAYTVSKAAMNAYTRILAKKYPSFCINCVCPGFVKTDINRNTGILPVEEGASSPVRLALLPNGSPSGLFFIRKEVSSF